MSRSKCKRCHNQVQTSYIRDGVCIDCLLQEGRNQVLYLLLVAGDDQVAHDHWHPEQAEFLLETRRNIIDQIGIREKYRKAENRWPDEWPDFYNYTYNSG